MASSLTVDVSVRTIEIAPTEQKPKDPVPLEFHGDGQGAPLNDAYGSSETFSNDCVAELVASDKSTNKYLKKYHEACVKVIAGNGENRIQGSGILFQTSEASQIVLITARHVIHDKGNVKIVLELNYKATTKENTFKAAEHTIKLQNQAAKINEKADIAAFLLSSDDSEYILEKIREFPRLGYLDDHSSEKFMSIHYSDGDYKKVSTGKRERMPGNCQLLTTRIHMQAGKGASGAPLFNFEGDVVAILRSESTQNPDIRYWTPTDPNDPNTRQDEFQSLFESIEAGIFTKTLSINLKNLTTKSEKGLLKGNESAKVAAEYLTVFQCLSVGGEHKYTKLHSKREKIESDHFPPYAALKMASETKDCHLPVKDFFLKHSSRTSGRCGENFLPAITIPKVFHRKHGSTVSKPFRQNQAKEIAAGEVFQAIKTHFYEYEKTGLFKRCKYDCSNSTFEKLMQKYREGFTAALKVHKELRFIKDTDVKPLKQVVMVLTGRNETEDDLSLERDDRIKVKDVEDLVKDVEDLRIGC